MISLLIWGLVILGAIALTVVFFFVYFGNDEYVGPTEEEKARARLMEKQFRDASRDVKRGGK